MPAGTYLALCVIPAPDGAPHFAHGMLKVLPVGDPSATSVPSEEILELPMDDVEGLIHVFDYGFALPEDFDGNGRRDLLWEDGSTMWIWAAQPTGWVIQFVSNMPGNGWTITR